MKNEQLVEMVNLDGDMTQDQSDIDLIKKSNDKSGLGLSPQPLNDTPVNGTPEEDYLMEMDEDILTEVSICPLGTFDLKINYDSRFYKVPKTKQEMKEEKFGKIDENLCQVNLIDFLNTKNIYDYNFKNFTKIQDIIVYFSKEINEYNNFNLLNPTEDVKTDPKAQILEYRNTGNSFINLIQKNHCLSNNFLAAFDMNRNYQEKKKTYELELIKNILKRPEDPEKKKEIIANNHLEMYEKLKSRSESVLKSYENYQNTKFGDILEMKNEAFGILVEFVNLIKKDSERENKSITELKKTLTYTLWKKRFSELINIWELYSSNGIELKFTYKYIIMKNFINSRAYERMNNIQKFEAKHENEIYKWFYGHDEDPFRTISIYQSKSGIRTIHQLILTFAYIFFTFTMCLRFWIPGFDSQLLKSIDLISDMFFLIDMMFSIRTIYRDKANNDVEDLELIFDRYKNNYLVLDLLTIIPWEVFIKQLFLHDPVRIIRNMGKLLRLPKIVMFLAPLETTTLANTYRLLKIVFFFLVCVLWMGSLIVGYVSDSLITSAFAWECYSRMMNPSKITMDSGCAFLLGVYHGPYMIIGRDSSYQLGTSQVYPTTEYILFAVEYTIGLLVNTYILGGITEILKNLNQGENFFTAKTDMLVEHMVFYDVSPQTQTDLKVYYDYLWQRHKDIIYGKRHFSILSRSLRERFEILNLPNNKYYLAKFYNLNLGSNKLVGKILMNLEKKILFPYEILFEEGSVCKGLYVLLNGDVELVTVNLTNVPAQKYNVDLAKIILKSKTKEDKDVKQSKLEKLDESFSIIFPLASVLIKTGRIWQRCYSEEFSDLLFLPITTFDELVENFPIEIHSLKHVMFEEVTQKKIFDNVNLFQVVCTHSSRSIGKYYEKEFNKINIWIPIAIPISQRKIANNYVDCFIKKIRNQYREINLSADLNISLRGFFITRLLQKNNTKKNEGEVKAAATGKSDRLEILKGEFGNIEGLVQEISSLMKSPTSEENLFNY